MPSCPPPPRRPALPMRPPVIALALKHCHDITAPHKNHHRQPFASSATEEERRPSGCRARPLGRALATWARCLATADGGPASSLQILIKKGGAETQFRLYWVPPLRPQKRSSAPRGPWRQMAMAWLRLCRVMAATKTS
jgi:hypothetical protein